MTSWHNRLRKISLLMSAALLIFTGNEGAGNDQSGILFTEPLPSGNIWILHVESQYKRSYNKNGIRQIFSLDMKMIREKGNQVIYTFVHGPQTLYRFDEKGEVNKGFYENRNGTISSLIDKHGITLMAKDQGHLSNDILLLFPSGSVWGILLPKKPVKVGQRWSSGDVIPLGPGTMSKKKFTFVHVSGCFTLESCEKKVAVITWTGTGEVIAGRKNRTVHGRMTWKRRIDYDLSQGMYASNKGSLVITLNNGMVMNYTSDISASAMYPGFEKRSEKMTGQ